MATAVAEERPSTTLLWIRHAQARARDGSYDQRTPLSELGLRQADAIARALGESAPAAIYSSPWPRALQTAELLARRAGMQTIIDARLAEFEMPPMPLDRVRGRPDLLLWRAEHRAAENGETLEAFSRRIAGFCEEIAPRHLGERVVVVAHSGTIEGALRWSVGLSLASPWQSDFDVSTASISELRVWPRGRASGGSPRYVALGRIGDTSHLAGLISDW